MEDLLVEEGQLLFGGSRRHNKDLESDFVLVYWGRNLVQKSQGGLVGADDISKADNLLLGLSVEHERFKPEVEVGVLASVELGRHGEATKDVPNLNVVHRLELLGEDEDVWVGGRSVGVGLFGRESLVCVVVLQQVLDHDSNVVHGGADYNN